MITFHISQPNHQIRQRLKERIDSLSKPKGSLGRLEELALQIGWIQQTLTPQLKQPVNLIFAADHGIADEGVSQSPKEVTQQVVNNFIEGGAGINFLARQHGFELVIIDAGVDYDFPDNTTLIDRKIRKGTRNFLYEAALTEQEVEKALRCGAGITDIYHAKGSNVISFGEMGVGNTSASSMWMTSLTDIPLLDCVGAGSGLSNEGVKHKFDVLNQALQKYTGGNDVMKVMQQFGGLEMVMAVGAMLRAAEHKMILLVDGFIMTNCILAASRINPNILSYALFGHCGDEHGHQLLLSYMQVNPILNLGLRLGEGSGAICAYPIIDSAVRMINEMHSFEDAAITKYF